MRVFLDEINIQIGGLSRDLPYVGGHHPVCWRSEWNKKQRKEESTPNPHFCFHVTDWAGTSLLIFSCPWTETYAINSPGSQVFRDHWLFWISSLLIGRLWDFLASSVVWAKYITYFIYNTIYYATLQCNLLWRTLRNTLTKQLAYMHTKFNYEAIHSTNMLMPTVSFSQKGFHVNSLVGKTY